MSEIKNFYKEYEDMFEEYLENTIGNLKYKNEKYKKLYQEYNDLLSKNKNLNWVLEGQVECVKVNIKLIKKYKVKLIKKFNVVFPENVIDVITFSGIIFLFSTFNFCQFIF